MKIKPYTNEQLIMIPLLADDKIDNLSDYDKRIFICQDSERYTLRKISESEGKHLTDIEITVAVITMREEEEVEKLSLKGI